MNQENDKLNLEDLDNQLNIEAENIQVNPKELTSNNIENVQTESENLDSNEIKNIQNESEELNSKEEGNTQAESKDLETFFKEHRNNGESYEVRSYGGLIVFLSLIALGLGGYIIFDKYLRIEDPVPEETNINIENPSDVEVEETEKTFTYENYSLKLPKKIDSIRDIYAIDVKTENYIDFDIYGRYTSEKDIKIATVTIKDNSNLEYRALDFDNNKLYFIINSKKEGTIFELNYIDLKDLVNGAKTIDSFNEIYKNDNLWQANGIDSYYPSQIYVKDNDIFYTSFVEKSLKTYNMETKKSDEVLKNIGWTEYFIDKRNNNIFYLNKSNKIYISDLNGKNQNHLKDANYAGSNFWIRAYYNNKPIFGFPNDSLDYVDIYAYDAENNTFIKIEGNASAYNARYNNINMKINRDPKVIGTFFIA